MITTMTDHTDDGQPLAREGGDGSLSSGDTIKDENTEQYNWRNRGDKRTTFYASDADKHGFMRMKNYSTVYGAITSNVDVESFKPGATGRISTTTDQIHDCRQARFCDSLVAERVWLRHRSTSTRLLQRLSKFASAGSARRRLPSRANNEFATAKDRDDRVPEIVETTRARRPAYPDEQRSVDLFARRSVSSKNGWRPPMLTFWVLCTRSMECPATLRSALHTALCPPTAEIAGVGDELFLGPTDRLDTQPVGASAK